MISPKSFGYATRGLKHVLSKERNARFHLTTATIVLVFVFYFYFFVPELKLSSEEVALVLLSILFVFISEIINTAIERTVDFIPRVGRPAEVDKAVEVAKDIMAGAVLVSALGAFVIGLLIFGTRFISLIKVVTQ